ncbi:MAG: type II secretion system secretin GspD [Planctomycetota bacterium]
MHSANKLSIFALLSVAVMMILLFTYATAIAQEEPQDEIPPPPESTEETPVETPPVEAPPVEEPAPTPPAPTEPSETENPPDETPKPNNQPDSQLESPTETTQEVDKDKEAFFVINAGDELTVGQLLEQIKKMTKKEIIPVPGIVERRIKFASSFKANYTILEKLLDVNGITLEHLDDRTIKLIIAELDQHKIKKRFGRTKFIEKDDELPTDNELVTAIVEVKYADPTQVEMTLNTKIVDRQGPGSIIAVRNQPVLIIRDFAPEVEYYLKIIQAIDVMPKGVELFIIRLQHAIATDVATYLSQLSQQGARFVRPGMRGGGVPQETGFEAQFVADARTNKLVILTIEENFSQIKRVVKELDEEMPRGTGNVHVYKLKHVDATKLATALQSILSGQQQRQTRSRVPQGALPEQLQEIQSRVVAEEQTNSLIIEAEQRNYDEIVKLIEILDIRSPQVLIEAAIIEVSVGSKTNMGIELATVDLAGTGFRGAAGTFYGLSTLNGDELSKTPIPGGGLTALMYRDSFDRIPILLQMLRTNTDVNVLSSPRLLTNDNQEGQLKITEQVGTTTYIDPAQGASRQQFGGYQEAGITLKITPHISTDNYLRLEIELKVEAFSASPIAGSVTPPPKTSREISGTVTIPNGEVIIVGGLTDEKETKTINKIPFLGDIPILGSLFRSTQTEKRKTNLYVFLTPHIISEEKFESLKKISKQQREDARLSGARTARLSNILENYSNYQAQKQSKAYIEMADSLKELFGHGFEKVYVLQEQNIPTPENKEETLTPAE